MNKFNGFKCLNCKKQVVINELMGTLNRNHCNFCLWSKHLDLKVSGDRKSDCFGGMAPIGLTFKKLKAEKVGELMLIHICNSCRGLSINRITADDNDDQILVVFESSLIIPSELRQQIEDQGIKLLNKTDYQELKTQLFGKSL